MLADDDLFVLDCDCAHEAIRSCAVRAPGALANRDFRWLWAGQTISAVGDGLFTVAIAALIVEAGGGAAELGLVLAGKALSLVLFVLVGGILADRLPRTRVMIGADAVRAIATLGVAVAGSEAPIALIAALTFAIGGGEAFFRPAYLSLVPRILPAELIQSGNSIGALSVQAAALGGPALAGVVIVAASPSVALYLDALTFLLSLLTLLFVRERRVAEERAPDGPAERTGAITEALAGLRAIRERFWIGAVILLAMSHLLILIGPLDVLLPVISEQELGGIERFGVLLAIFGAGAIVGAALCARIRPSSPGVWALIGIMPLGVLMFFLVGPAPLWAIAAVFFIAGIGEQVFTVLWTTGVQRDVPDELLGRVFSLDYLGSLGLLPLGLALAGPVTDLIGRDALLIASGTFTLVSSALVLLSPQIRAFSSRPQEASA
ncbi:MFS transporter [Thermoleophilia bacterium SCSIO 60948]|nr:MFS transporter [Thermoleophilia bacterium SCSIO 60948]